MNWLANKFVLNRDPKHFRNRVRKILYITSIIGLVLFGLPAYVFNKRFTNYGAFCWDYEDVLEKWEFMPWNEYLI